MLPFPSPTPSHRPRPRSPFVNRPAYPCFGLGMLLLGFLAAALFFLQRSRLTFLPLGHIGKMHKSMKKVEEDANTVGAQGVELTPPKGENPSAVAVGVTSPAPVTV